MPRRLSSEENQHNASPAPLAACAPPHRGRRPGRAHAGCGPGRRRLARRRLARLRPARPRPRRHRSRGGARDDFFRYANGNWLKATEIPPDRSSYGTSAMLAELTTQRTVDLIRAAADGAAAGSEAAKIGDYYASFMDEAAIESQGLRPLEPALRSIDSIADRAGLARALGATLRADVR